MVSTSDSYFAGTGTSDTYIGGVAWTNPGNINSSDNSYATVNLSLSNTSSQGLKATNFNFSLPSYASVDGIVATFQRKASIADTIRDTHVYLIKNGSVSGNNKSQAAYWSTVEGDVSFGGPADLWGNSLTASDVNSSNFGVLIACAYYSAYAGTETAYVDSVQLTVYYTYNPFQQCKIGSTGVSKIYYGSTQVDRVYYGNIRVI